jgi:chromosomal replication initiation ATPase DnaA
MIKKENLPSEDIIKILSKEFIERIKKETGKDYNIQIINHTLIASRVEQIIPRKIVSLDDLEKIILRNMPVEIPSGKFKSKSRIRELVDARTIFCYMACRIFGFTVTNVGRYLKKHHTSVMYLVRKCEILMEVDPEYLGLFQSVKDKLKEAYEEVL